MKVNFSCITPGPQNAALIDIAHSKSQRGSSTAVHPQCSTIRFRKFYMLKVKKAGSEFKSRLETIVTNFLRPENVLPVYADLTRVLYDRDHYKLALVHVSSSRKVVEGIVEEFVKLLKYGNTFHRCKQLKRAALVWMNNGRK